VSQLMTDLLSRGAASVVGLAIVIATAISLMRTVVIPRALRSLISDVVAKVVVELGIGLSMLRRTFRGRDAVLAGVGPSIILLQLITWLVLFLIGYGLLIYGVSGGLSIGEAIRQSGSSLLTLGFASTDRSEQTVVDFIAAATGPIVIALLIGFLPTIYSVYLEREQEVTMLAVSGGGPAWGPEVLARYSVAHEINDLHLMYRSWSQWAARLRLTHVTYPVMLWVRSSRSSQHYITSLIAVLDAAALQLSLSRTLRQSEAYMVLLQGVQALELLFIFLFRKRAWRVAKVFTKQQLGGVESSLQHVVTEEGRSRTPLVAQAAANLDSAHELDQQMLDRLIKGGKEPITVTRADFDTAVDMLTVAGFPIEVERDEAWRMFSIYRARYEFAALSIAYRLDATPAPWTGRRRKPTPVTWPTSVVSLLPGKGTQNEATS